MNEHQRDREKRATKKKKVVGGHAYNSEFCEVIT